MANEYISKEELLVVLDFVYKIQNNDMTIFTSLDKLFSIKLGEEHINRIEETIIRQIESNPNFDFLSRLIDSLVFLDQTFLKLKLEIKDITRLSNQSEIKSRILKFLDSNETLSFKKQENEYKIFYEFSMLAVSTGEPEIIKKSINKLHSIND